MPRVYTYTTRARRKHAASGHYRCVKCGEDILPGQKRYEWSFRYGGTYRRHVDCGYPRQSELTQSKMATVYAATEDLEDQLAGEFDPEDVDEMLRAAAESVREVAEEYEQAAESFGNAGENQERYEALDSYADDLERVDLPEQGEDTMDDWRDNIRNAVSDAVSQCPY